MRFARFAFCFAVFFVALFSGCKSCKEVRSPTPSSTRTTAVRDLTTQPGNTFQVKYTSNTVVIDRSTAIKALQSVSADGTVLVFDDSETALKSLAPGKVLLLERIALRKIQAIKREGGHLAVLTEPASLPEAIQNGVIKWRLPVRFSELARGRAKISPNHGIDLLPEFLPAAYADTANTISGEKNGWKYTITGTPAADRLNLVVNMTKDVNGFVVSLDATGYVPDFETLASIVIDGGVLKEMDYQNKNLSGEMQFNISAATKSKPGNFGKKQVKLPAILKCPFFLGALPFSLEISSAITFTPGLGANNQLATAKFHLKYTDLNGFEFHGGNPTTNGGSDGDGEIVDASGITMAGIGVVAGIAMPRLEFKLGTSSIVDMIEKALPTDLGDMFRRTFLGNLATKAMEEAEESIKTEGAAHVQVVLVGSFLASGPLSLIPCQKTTFSFRADAGADASVLGKSIGEMSVDLFKKEIVKTNPPNIKCG